MTDLKSFWVDEFTYIAADVDLMAWEASVTGKGRHLVLPAEFPGRPHRVVTDNPDAWVMPLQLAQAMGVKCTVQSGNSTFQPGDTFGHFTILRAADGRLFFD